MLMKSGYYLAGTLDVGVIDVTATYCEFVADSTLAATCDPAAEKYCQPNGIACKFGY